MSVIGVPTSRRDGRAKVSGAARYAAEFAHDRLLHGVLVPAAVAHGRVVRIDAGAASAVPGVVTVFTHASFPRVDMGKGQVPPLAQSYLPLQDDRIFYEGQAIALVVAETLEQAEEAACKLHVDYDAAPPARFDGTGRAPRRSGYMFDAPEHTTGRGAAALAEAAVVVEQAYSLPSRHHNPMEPSATIASWDGDRLDIVTATQWTYGVRYALAPVLGIPPRNIRVRCPFTGGGFGCKGYTWPHQVLAVVAARALGRPLKLVLTRAQMYVDSGYQPAMRNRVALGAGRDGKLTAIRHETVNVTSVLEDYVEFGSAGTAGLYGTPNMALASRIQPANLPTPTAMRAPHEGPGMFALESAMDELAYALGIDPVALRLRNDTTVDPSSGKPYSTRKLKECIADGAARFGWARRPMAPRSLRQGDWLVGQGMACAVMSTFRFGANARARMRGDGTALIEAGTQEIGTGTTTIFPMIAAEALGLDPARVAFAHGDTDLPETGGTFGSSSTMGVGSAVSIAATELRKKLVDLARQQDGSPLRGLNEADIAVSDGRLASRSAAGRSDTYADIVQRAGLAEVTADGVWSPGAAFDAAGHSTPYAIRTFGAIFAEVAVDAALGVVRLKHCVGVYNAGRIINPKTAISQMTGGMIWGVGQALLEESAVEPQFGRFLAKNLAGVMLPVNADIPALEAAFVEDHDPHASPLGAKGIGELGAVGVSAAIANAVFHATGTRVRDLPIRIEQLMGA